MKYSRNMISPYFDNNNSVSGMLQNLFSEIPGKYFVSEWVFLLLSTSSFTEHQSSCKQSASKVSIALSKKIFAEFLTINMYLRTELEEKNLNYNWRTKICHLLVFKYKFRFVFKRTCISKMIYSRSFDDFNTNFIK